MCLDNRVRGLSSKVERMFSLTDYAVVYNFTLFKIKKLQGEE